jgi:sterol desaturase/sphingolipid hydroxylase (fatty acid hydroxylase superfamily)
MNDAFVTLSAREVMLYGVLFFAAIYSVSGVLNWVLTEHVLPAIGFGRRIDPRALAAGQIRREVGASLVSILIFGVGLIFPWGILQLGWAHLAHDPSWWRIGIEIIVLFFWNEAHFYVSHRVLHTRWLRRFHAPHHHSHVATPFSTYSFHPVEAIMLGSVPLIPMLLYDFSFSALLSLPLMSIALNNLGHSNYEFTHNAPAHGWLGASRRHHLHHACYNGNYGFLIGVFDTWFHTALPLDAADARLKAARAQAPNGA